MNALSAFLKDRSGAAAAESALVVPIALLFLLGIMDVGRYVWVINEAEKAVQMGTRYAVATSVVAEGLKGAEAQERFGCTERTFRLHVENAKRKMRAANGSQAVYRAQLMCGL